MKINLKVIVALVVIVAALAWAFTSVQTQAYSGSNLNFSIGQGVVAVTNPGDAPVPVQLVSRGARAFTVVSPIAELSGTSATQGTGSDRSQLFEFAAPAGVSQFTVTRGTNVSFVTTDAANLIVSVQAISENDLRTTLIVAAVVVLGGLFYISRSTGHGWISRLRGQVPVVQPTTPAVVSAAAGQGAEIRAYGDNRTNISKP